MLVTGAVLGMQPESVSPGELLPSCSIGAQHTVGLGGLVFTIVEVIS